MITESIIPDTIGEEDRDVMLVRQTALNNIKSNLKLAQDRTKKQAYKHRTKRIREVGDTAYLKLQPYRHNALGVHKWLKLHSKFYGPFKIIQKLGQVAYKLLLSEGCGIHPVFHVSHLKKRIDPMVIPQLNLPPTDQGENIQMHPEELLQTHSKEQ
jgi:hypothetical protein